MPVRVQLFAALREAAGSDSIEIDLRPSGDISAGDVMRAVSEKLPELAGLIPACRLAVNDRYVSEDDAIAPSDSLALIPPVSGG